MAKAKKRPAPAKPYPDFPLFRHATGQWAKKIRQKLYYFGVDADAALLKYTNARDDLQARRAPRTTTAGVTVRDLVNRFLTSKRVMMDAISKDSAMRLRRNAAPWRCAMRFNGCGRSSNMRSMPT